MVIKKHNNIYIIGFIIGFVSIFIPLVAVEIIFIIGTIRKFGESFNLYKSLIDIFLYAILSGCASLFPAHYYKNKSKLFKIVIVIYLFLYLIFLVYITGFIYAYFWLN